MGLLRPGVRHLRRECGDRAVQREPGRPTFTSSLEALANWLQTEGVTQVVMEATGQYWNPAGYVLEERGFHLRLVNARHVKILPGRKTDLGDAAWLAELEHGLLEAASYPQPPSASCAT